MSVFRKTELHCPACAVKIAVDAVLSVNGGRRADLREAVLDGSLQEMTCPTCSATFRLDPEFTYVDLGRGQWLAVHPAAAAAYWPEREAAARATFDRAYGAAAPRSAQELGASLRPRVVFGWAALREKLVADEAGLDDVTLEGAKAAILRTSPPPRFGDTELRLVEVGDPCRMAWIRSGEETVVEELEAPRALFDEIAAAPKAWKALREELAAGLFVDLGRMLVVAR
jgi:hypothetical protein